ncbi:MAG: hypothetical protein V3W43_13665 [Desulfatiglandaceae bacterium]
MNEEKKGEEELLDFEFDDLPDEDAEETNSTLAPEEEILELTDIVGEGDEAGSVADSAFDDIERILDEAPTEKKAVEESIGISEERIEAIISKVVGDVVERVARETMTRVAEKVIREAIDDLRQSLDLPPE